MRRNLAWAAASAAVLNPATAFAHPGHLPPTSFTAGLLHPLTGLDHLLAMVAVGLLAARIGGRATWALPLTFVSVMSLGGALGMAGVWLPASEAVIAASVLALGLLVAVPRPERLTALLAMVGGFALFHGAAHGAEMPKSASGLRYAAGFLAATGMLHGAGLVIGMPLARSERRLASSAVRVIGSAIAATGAGLLLAMA